MPDSTKCCPAFCDDITEKFAEALNKNKRIFLECNHGNYVNPEKMERKACGKGRNTIK